MIEIFNALQPFKDDPTGSGIFSDLDGTLSKVAPTPRESFVSEDMRSIIERLAGKFAVVSIVSGRDSDDAKRIVNLEKLIYVGNHGLEWQENGRQYFAPEAGTFAGLISELGGLLGARLGDQDIYFEQKKMSISVHYRQATDPEATRMIIEEQVAPFVAQYPLRQFDGRYVVELRPDIPIHKGDALTAIALRKGIDRAIYIGDDVTDIDAFMALKSLRQSGKMETVAIGVASGESAPEVEEEADYIVHGVGQVQELLAWLAGEQFES